MAPKYHYPPISSGDRKALKKELSKSRAMTKIFAERSAERRHEGEALIREADNLACQSWNEKMWSDGGTIDPSPTIDRAINGGYPWLEIKCLALPDAARCRFLCAAPRAKDLRARSRRVVGLSEMPEGREATARDAAPTYAAFAQWFAQ